MAKVYSPVGADLTSVGSSPEFELGTVARASDGQRYVYVISSGSLAQYALVCIDENFTARGGTTALAAEANGPGWPQVAFATDQYGWVATEGANLQGKLKDGVAANAQLYTSTSVGIMGSESSTGTPLMIAGVRVAVAGSGAGNPGEIIAINPHFVPKTAAL
jgi:hypothetical protein